MEDSPQIYNIFNLKMYDIFIFPASWLMFAIIGRAFFESGLGKYHSTHSKQWATLCKSLFLLTFVTCCTLLELVTFEILDLLHPALRLFTWTTSLSILALLLNVLIPAVLAISMGFHVNFSLKVSVFMGGVSVGLFQLLMWITSSLVHYYHNSYFPSSGYKPAENDLFGNSLNGITSPGVMKWIFMFDRENANNHDGYGYLLPAVHLLKLIMSYDVQRSIANIAVLGTICAAVISGFATVFFPLEQLLIFRGVDAEQLRRRERSLSQLLREIATRKKELLMMSMTITPPPTPSAVRTPRTVSSEVEYNDRRPEVTGEDAIETDKFSLAFDAIAMDRISDEQTRRKLRGVSAAPEMDQHVNCCAVNNRAFKLLHLSKNAEQLEELSTSLFKEIIALKEQQRMAEMARTQWGRIMRLLGQILTAVAIARLLVGVWHILDHLRTAIVAYKDSEIALRRGDSVGLDDIYSVGAVFSSSGKDSLSESVDYAPIGHDFGVGLDRYMEESMVGSDGEGVSKSHQGDLVTTSLSFLLVHLKIDGTAWAPSLSSAYIASMSLMQVRAFLVAMEQLASLGIMSTSTELYSLALALLAGFYFMACVWQLSFQLPLRCRRGVTAALGETAPFELCFLLFDAVFVVSALFFGLMLWIDHRKKLLLSRNITAIEE